MKILKLKTMINDPESNSGTYFNYFIQLLIVVSLTTFSIETLPKLSRATFKLLNITEIIIVIIFTIEYILRIYFAPKKLKFIFSFHGIIDFLAILPFYASMNFDLRALRIFRLLRFLRVFKLFHHNKAVSSFYNAFKEVKGELILFLVFTTMILYLSAVGIYYFEHEAQPKAFASVFHSFWWAVVTLTTVGYGDVYPITAGGKVFTTVILMVGLGIVAIPTGLISSALTETNAKRKEERAAYLEQQKQLNLPNEK